MNWNRFDWRKKWKKKQINRKNYPFNDRSTWYCWCISSFVFGATNGIPLHTRRICERANKMPIICVLMRFDLIFVIQLNRFWIQRFSFSLCFWSQIDSNNSLISFRTLIIIHEFFFSCCWSLLTERRRRNCKISNLQGTFQWWNKTQKKLYTIHQKLKCHFIFQEIFL